MMYRALFGVLGAGLVCVGCGPGLAPPPAAAQQQPTSLTLPPPRPPRPQLSAAEAALISPEPDKLTRDPFLTYEEEHPVEVKPVEVAAVVVRKPKPKGPTPLVLKQLHETVTGIITGPRNTFFFQGKLFEEGDTLPDSDWVVISIKPTGIRLRSKDGATDFLPFVTDSSSGGLLIKKSD